MTKNERIEKKIKEAAHGFSLTHDEKSAIREKLVLLLEEGELREPISSPAEVVPFATVMRFRRFAPVILLVFFILGTGVSYASQSSLPGDSLYGVKKLVEKFGSVLVLNKAGFELKLAERRLAEAEALSETGSLTEEGAVLITAHFLVHSQAMTGASESEKRQFAILLKIHSDILGQLFQLSGDPELKVLAEKAEGGGEQNSEGMSADSKILNLEKEMSRLKLQGQANISQGFTAGLKDVIQSVSPIEGEAVLESVSSSIFISSESIAETLAEPAVDALVLPAPVPAINPVSLPVSPSINIPAPIQLPAAPQLGS